jgi:hypothetical protein
MLKPSCSTKFKPTLKGRNGRTPPGTHKADEELICTPELLESVDHARLTAPRIRRSESEGTWTKRRVFRMSGSSTPKEEGGDCSRSGFPHPVLVTACVTTVQSAFDAYRQVVVAGRVVFMGARCQQREG